jgi:hypothetical protein
MLLMGKWPMLRGGGACEKALPSFFTSFSKLLGLLLVTNAARWLLGESESGSGEQPFVDIP